MKKWTEKEIQILKSNYNIKFREDLCDILHYRTWNAIKKKAKNLSLKFINLTSEELFWNFVNKKEDSCWRWTGSINTQGYGHFHCNGKLTASHRFSWILHFGEIPKNRPCVLHHCDNPKCVNPKHLFLEIQKDNMLDMRKKNRQANHRGENNSNYKLTIDQVKEIRRLCCERKIYQREIAKMFNVHEQTIGRIHRNKMWKHIME